MPEGCHWTFVLETLAVDRGSALDAPADDLDGRLRPWDGNGDDMAGYDIGAYEAGAQIEYAICLPLVVRNGEKQG